VNNDALLSDYVIHPVLELVLKLSHWIWLHHSTYSQFHFYAMLDPLINPAL